MGETDTAPAAPAPPMPDLTVLEVFPDQGERFFKAAFVHSKQGTTYRIVAKTLSNGRLDLVRFACDLGSDGIMAGKWAIWRIESQPLTRFDAEIATVQKEITDKGEEVQGVWPHDLTGIQDVAEQASSLEAWLIKAAKEIVSS
jgi:hypothetical protein